MSTTAPNPLPMHRAEALGIHGCVVIDDACHYASVLRNELLNYPCWREMTQLVRAPQGATMRRVDYANQTGITTGHITADMGLEACWRFRAEIELSMRALATATGAAAGTGPLRVEMNAMAYGEGGHLLAHTDYGAERDRRVAWILYLTEPDEPWGPKDGGGLLLRSEAEERTVYPLFNRLTAFRVYEHSLHEIGRVLRRTTWTQCRLALSGWIAGAPSNS
jgi:Rps23 Pro-64 3,4-dihydroxylase Tpa1-like proline 4-hydroxylase